MLNRFYGCSLKIARLVQIVHHAGRYSAPKLNYLQNSRKYTATVSNYKNTKTNSLNAIILELNNRAKYRLCLLDNHLQSLLTRLKVEKANSAESLKILRCCSQAITDPKQRHIVNNIWIELKKHNQFQIEHYNYYLDFLKFKRDTKRGQEIFDEMIANGIQPDETSYRTLLSMYCKCGVIEMAIKICDMMEKNNVKMNEGAFNNLMQCHIMCRNMDAAKQTMAKLKEAKFRVNLHTLRTLLVHYAKTGDLPNIENTFLLFKEDNWNLVNRDVLKVMCELSINGHSHLIDSLFVHLEPIELRAALLRAITLFVENKQSRIIPKILQMADGDVGAMYKLLIYEMVRLSTDEVEFTETIAHIENLGMTKQLLDSLFGVGSDQSEQIQNQLQLDGDKENGLLLKKLITEQLIVKPDQMQGNAFNADNNLTMENLVQFKPQDNDSYATDRLQFLAHVRGGNVQKVESLMTSGRFIFSNSDYALIIDMYARLGNVENALKILKRASLNNIFKLNQVNVSRLVTVMFEKGCEMHEIEAVLSAHSQDRTDFRISFFNVVFKRLADDGNVRVAEQFFDILYKHGYIIPTADTTKPIIYAHLKNDSFADAVAKYEYYAKTHNFVTLTRLLYIQLIEPLQQDLLQRVFDCDKEISGEKAAIRCLASAYTECGKHLEVRKLLDKFHQQNLSIYIKNQCEKYVIHRGHESAKTLLKATRGLHCNHHLIYQCILDIYEKQNKAQDALNLWHEYCQEPAIFPTQQFRKKLTHLLRRNNVEVPDKLKNTHKKRIA